MGFSHIRLTTYIAIYSHIMCTAWTDESAEVTIVEGEPRGELEGGCKLLKDI